MSREDRGLTVGTLARRSLLLVLCIVAVSATASASADGALPGEIMWPPQPDAGPAELAEIGREALNVSDPLVVGHPARGPVDVERINDTASRITIHDRDGGEQSYVQRHRPPQDPSYPTLHVSIGRLEPSVHITPKEPHSVMQIYGPPGTFEANGTTPGALVDDFRRSADLPPLESVVIGDRGFNLRAFYAACAERVDGDCEKPVTFRLDCGNCDQRTYIVQPTPRQELDATTNLTVGGHHNLIRLHIRQGSPEQPPELVAVQLPIAFDLNVSQVLSPDEAGQIMVDALNERGYRIAERRNGEIRSGLDGLGGVSPNLRMNDRQLHPDGGSYVSGAIVTEESRVSENSSPEREGLSVAEVSADMQSGAVQHLDVRSRISHGEPREEGSGANENKNASNATPVDAPAALAAAVALAASALAVRRRSRGT